MIPFLVVHYSARRSTVVAVVGPVGTAGAAVGPVLPRLEPRRVRPRKVVPFYT